MALVRGQDVLLQISSDTGTTWKDIICLTTNTVNRTRETQTAPFTKCNVATAAQEVTPLGYSWEMTFDALVDTSPTASQVTFKDMQLLFDNGTTVMVRQQYDGTGSEFYDVGTAILTSLTSERPADGFVQFAGTFTGSGAIDNSAS